MPILTSVRASIGRKLRPRREVEVNSPDDLVELAEPEPAPKKRGRASANASANGTAE